MAFAFQQSAIQSIAEISYDVNKEVENIGARRLYTVLERLLEEISFEAPDYVDKTLNIDKNYVNQKLSDLVKDRDLSRYIL